MSLFVALTYTGRAFVLAKYYIDSTLATLVLLASSWLDPILASELINLFVA